YDAIHTQTETYVNTLSIHIRTKNQMQKHNFSKIAIIGLIRKQQHSDKGCNGKEDRVEEGFFASPDEYFIRGSVKQQGYREPEKRRFSCQLPPRHYSAPSFLWSAC